MPPLAISIAPATAEHVAFIAAHLRASDRAEAAALSSESAETLARRSVSCALEAWCGLVDGEPVALFGLTLPHFLATTAQPFFVATEALPRHAMAMLRRNRAVVQGWLQRFPVLEQWVGARNDMTLRWLRWLGFHIEPAAPFGTLWGSLPSL